VLRYVRAKYGTDRVCQVATFGTLGAKAAVKDVGKAMGVPFTEMNALSKSIPSRPGTTLAGALLSRPDFAAAYNNNPKYKKIIDAAIKLEGSIRQL
jgi:DNA polymerase III subunit alpha